MNQKGVNTLKSVECQKALQVPDGELRYRCCEAIGLGDDPIREEAAAAPAGHGDTDEYKGLTARTAANYSPR